MHILVLTPTIDGKFNAGYVSSLINTILICKERGIDVLHYAYSYDPTLPHSRNVLLKEALNFKADAAVWIDSDIEWNPYDFLKLVESDLDVVGGTYRIKNDIEDYPLVFKSLSKEDIVPIDGMGFGFIKMSKSAMQDLWDSCSIEYFDDGILFKNVFENLVIDGNMCTEDIVVCYKLKDLGYTVYLDKNITCTHVGVKKYTGNFYEWQKNI